MKTGRVWLCWSPSQQAIHIEEVEAGLENNLRLFATNRLPDFVPIAEFDTRDAADKFAAHIKCVRDARQRHLPEGGGLGWN